MEKAVFPYHEIRVCIRTSEKTRLNFMQEVFKDKYLKEGITDDRTDIVILSRNLNCISVEREPKKSLKKKKKREEGREGKKKYTPRKPESF